MGSPTKHKMFDEAHVMKKRAEISELEIEAGLTKKALIFRHDFAHWQMQKRIAANLVSSSRKEPKF